MYRVDTGDFSIFKTFLTSVNTDWVNIILTDDGALFIQNVAGMFAALQLKSSRSHDDTNRVFRIDLKTLKMMTVDGFMDINVGNDSVNIDFLDRSAIVRRSIALPIHQAFTSTFNEKLAIFSMERTNGFDASSLKSSITLSKSLDQFFEVSGGIVGILDRNGTIVHRKASGIPDLSLTSEQASKLYQCSHVWYCSGTYVYASNDNYGIIATQCRGHWSSDYTEMISEKSKYAAVFEVDLSPAFEIFKMVKCDYLKLLFEGKCEFSTGTECYKIPVSIQNYKASEKYNDKYIVMDRKLVNDILPKLGDNTVKICVARNHLQIECNGFYVMCRRIQEC